MLIPIEAAIIEAALGLRREGEETFYGYLIAKRVRQVDGLSTLTAHGTLYKALSRLESAGLLTSSWEPIEAATAEGRPRRRLYEITGAAERAVAIHRAGAAPSPFRRLGLDPA